MARKIILIASNLFLKFCILIKGKITTLKVNEINTIEDFSKIRSQWNAVLEKSNDNIVSLTWEHIAVSVKNLKKNQLLRILYITVNDKIIAIAPLRQSKYKVMGHLSYSVIEPLDYGNSTDYTGLILTEQAFECLQAFLMHLYSQGNWDCIRLNDVPASSHLIDLLIKSKHMLPKFKIEGGDTCPYITIPNSMEDYLNRLSRNFKKNLRRRLRNLERDHGTVELKEYHELGSLEDTMSIFFNLHQARWTLKGGPGAFRSQNTREIFMDRAKLFAEKGWLGLYFLTVNNKPIAAKYTLKYNQKIYGCLSGFDPTYSSYSVGILVLMKLIEKCIEQGIKEYDFMKGDESYKFELADKTRRNLNLEFVNRRLVSHLIILVIQVKKILFLKNRKITKASIKHLLSLFNSRVDKKLIKQHN